MPPIDGRFRQMPVLTALLGLAVLVTAGVALARDRPVPRAFGATAAPAQTVIRSPQSVGTPALPLAISASVSSAARTATPEQPPAPPALLEIPALGVRATFEPVVSTDGVLGVPADPARVGWWSASALTGATSGTMVIDGHVDSAATGPGALFRLTALRAGDRLVITATSGEHRGYAVTGRRAYPKDGGLPADLFATQGPPRLVLITCGGPFDHAARSYLDNIAVFAAPA
jgi:Sortase domain